ncbi:phosphoribosyl-ATP pyrophosphatase [Rhodopirellula europaea SH398]|uniref:Phosphoribosyl-ATP pyrophosphatase n=1 Tax=Rhodopirellula europaea SH398 TaxID=1263868 RepID=M5SNB7_9BACT|nr:phosphoribosyl-ATP pyrophosphatase [Rhodopirellula europaea SH398]
MSSISKTTTELAGFIARRVPIVCWRKYVGQGNSLLR